MAEKRENLLTTEEAEKEILSWADIMEVDTDRDFFSDVIDELRMPVKKGRMEFDPDSEVFKYLLIKQVKAPGKDEPVSMVEITECDFKSKRVIQKFKDNQSIDSAEALVAKYTNLSPSAVAQMKDRDVSKINAVILGFFAQAASSTK